MSGQSDPKFVIMFGFSNKTPIHLVTLIIARENFKYCHFRKNNINLNDSFVNRPFIHSFICGLYI